MVPTPRPLPRARQSALLADAVNQIGPGPYQLIVLFLGGGIYAAEGSLLLILSLVAKNIINYWDLSALTAGALAGVVFVGLVLGTFVGGTACDQYGRRLPILITYVGIILFLLLCLASPYLVPLVLAKFMLGFFLGLGLPATNAIVCESCPPSHRANIYSITMVLFSLGQVYAAFALWLLNPELREDSVSWRGLLAVGALPPAVCLVGAHFLLLESAHWLLAQERFSEAKEVIIRIARYNQSYNQNDTMAVEFALSTIDSARFDAQTEQTSQVSYPQLSETAALLEDAGKGVMWRQRVLFTSSWRRTTLIMCYICFVANFAYFGMVYGLPHTMRALPSGGSLTPAAAVFFSALFEVPGVFLAILLGNTLGRKINMFVTFLCTFLFLCGTLYAIFEDKMDTIGLWTTFGVKMFIASSFIVVYLYLLECYPTMFRATGLAFCMVVGRLGAFICPFLHDGLIQYDIRTVWFFLTMDILTFLAAVIVWFLPLETKDAPLPEC